MVRLNTVLPRSGDDVDLLEAELIERRGQAGRIEGQAGVQLERRRVDAGGDIPAPILELADRADTDDEHVDQQRAQHDDGDRPPGRLEEYLL